MAKEKKSRTWYTIKNVIFNFGYQIINTITNLIVPPMIITKYGSVINGLISTIKQIINYIQLVGAGISESTVVSLYKPLAEEKKEKVSSIYKASQITFNKAGTFFSIIAVLVAFIYPIFVTEQLSYGLIVKIILILAIMGASEFFAIGKYRSLLTADQKVYMVNIAQAFGAIVSTIATIIMIKLNCSIVLVQLAAMITYIMRILILHYYVKKNYSYLDKKAKPDYTAVSKRKDATIHQIAALIIFGSQTLFISKFCGLAEASVYSVYNIVFTGINTVLSTVSSAILAGMGNLMATSNEEKVNKVYSIYEFLYYILVFTCYITTYIMILPFIQLYVGNTVDVNYIRIELVILFTIMGLLNCLRTPGATIINAKGHYKETKNRAIIEMLICLVLQIVLVGRLGIQGVLIATIVAYLYRTLDVILYSNRKILKRNILKTLTRIAINSLIMILAILLIQIKGNIEDYLEWIIVAMIIVIISFVIVLIVNILTNRKTFKETLEYLKNIFRKKSINNDK